MSVPPELPKQDFTTIDKLHVDGSVEGPGFDRFAIRVISMTAWTVLNGHRFVSADGKGKAVLAGGDQPHVIGLVVAAAEMGVPVEVIVSGAVTHDGWNWTEGEIFLGPNGIPTQNLPANFPALVTVGKAISATTMLLGIESPIFNP